MLWYAQTWPVSARSQPPGGGRTLRTRLSRHGGESGLAVLPLATFSYIFAAARLGTSKSAVST
jgi:hypothetical protein